MYKRQGFREFTEDEARDLTHRITQRYLASQLWTEGINPETGEMTGKRRYTTRPGDLEKLDHIPFETRLRMVAEIFTKEYGHASALDSNRRLHARKVREHLVVEDE